MQWTRFDDKRAHTTVRSQKNDSEAYDFPHEVLSKSQIYETNIF